ncbi:hypothetical protein [Gordonia sihwensis]|uniref:hypothetical protein n=1 Tax=Gordonia sihwensis TaxID=173559 RepID=UPI0005EEA5F9|nr:hypothetical protein [Gordonia sihwensis]KJR10259.1 hypothetical protein UG54_01380 [Gordonia sihwensis]
MINTVTRTDIVDHVVRPSLESSGDQHPDEMIDAVTDAVLESAPLGSWQLTKGLQYVSDQLDDEQYWEIVQSVLTK